MTVSEHVGSRIRMYRKLQKLNLEDFSKMIHKSIPTLSKYEGGKISIDIETLFDIAAALHVSVNQLTDYEAPSEEAVLQANQPSFFEQTDLYYAYYYFGIEKKIYICILEILRNPEQDNKIKFYVDVDDLRYYTHSNYLYNGTLSSHSFSTALLFENSINAGDKGFAYIKEPFMTDQKASGILTLMSHRLRNPVSTKILFSLIPLDPDDSLRQLLSVSTKDSIGDLRKSNMLIVY